MLTQALETFYQDLTDWLDKNNLRKVQHFTLDTEFGYCDKDHTLYIGTIEIEIEIQKWFVEFLEENGLEWEEIPVPVLAFLHEVGHSETLYQFTEEDSFTFWIKKLALENKDDRKAAFDYWFIDDEFAANAWLIKFVNENINSVIELIRIYATDWNNLANYLI